MWALIEDNAVKVIYKDPKPFTLNSISYPDKVFTLWTDSQREEIGIFPITAGTKKDEDYYTNGDPSYTWNASQKKVAESYSPSARTLSTVKTEQTRIINNRAHFYIYGYNWMIERYVYDNSKAIPDSVKTYVSNIRSEAGRVVTLIDNASNVDAVASAVNSASWASDEDVINFRRER